MTFMPSLFKKLRKFAMALGVFAFMVGFAYAPASPALAPKPVEATGWPVFDISNVIQTTISAIANVSSEINTWYLQWKETVGDGIAWTLINMVVEQMIRDTTAWVASGFQGKPAFVEDLGGYLGNLADDLVGEFIWESDTLAFLCSPFSLDIKIALDIQYSGARDYQMNAARCSLSGALDNAEDSLEGFMSGGWGDWFQVTMNQDNNPYGAMYKAQRALSANISTARNNETQTLDFGSGFFSLRDEYGNIITPGQTIQMELSNALNVPRERLGVADEINELFGALLTQLLRGALSEVGGGLRGLGSSGGVFDNPDYTSTTGTVGAGMSRQFDADRAQEERYRTVANQGIGVINSALGEQGAQCDEALRQELIAQRPRLTNGIAEAQGHIATIDDYEARINSGTASVGEIQQLIQEYMNEVRPTLHSTRELAELEASLAAITNQEDGALEALAAAGNIRALAALYEESCDPSS